MESSITCKQINCSWYL